MPTGPHIQNELYCTWVPQLEKLFPGYHVGGYNPGYVMIPEHAESEGGVFVLPLKAAYALLGLTKPEK
jgi:hypothetical protein